MIYCFIKTSISYDDLEHVILRNQEGELKSFALPLDSFTDELTHWVGSTFKGTIISKALDIFCLRINDEKKIADIKQIVKKWSGTDFFRLYCGISNEIDEAYKAMAFAEANRLKTIMIYSEEVEEFLQKELKKIEPKIDDLIKMALKDIKVPEAGVFRRNF